MNSDLSVDAWRSVACCPHGGDPETCGDCPSVRLTPREFFTLYNSVWAMGYALTKTPEIDVLKRCHDEMAEIVLRRADDFGRDFGKAHRRHS